MSAAPLRLLFVDDEARITRALKALFRDCDVVTCNDPAAAPELAERYAVDVVVCDQRMPGISGVDCLREILRRAPRAMRILLTGFSDLRAVLGSVNEGEVYRFVNKPWDNRELRELVFAAGRIAREAPALASGPLPEPEQAEARGQVGVLVIEDDLEVQRRLREILQPHYAVRFAASAERALTLLEEHEIGVVISETANREGDLTALLKALKELHPHIATIVVTDRANAQLAIDLINEGQVFRLLLKPVRMGSCRLSVDAAVGRYWQLKRQPAAVHRFAPLPRLGQMARLPSLDGALLSRLRTIPSRLASMARFG